jgi:hypothetical protein
MLTMDLEEVLCSGKVKMIIMMSSEYTMVIANKSNKRFHRKCIRISRYKRTILKNRNQRKSCLKQKRTTEEDCVTKTTNNPKQFMLQTKKEKQKKIVPQVRKDESKKFRFQSRTEQTNKFIFQAKRKQ